MHFVELLLKIMKIKSVRIMTSCLNFKIKYSKKFKFWALRHLMKYITPKYNWASEASPTLGCSIEISRDICIYILYIYVYYIGT